MATLKELLSTIISKVNSKVESINGIAPDDNGNVEIQPGVQSDWSESNETSPAFVKNKPDFATVDYVSESIGTEDDALELLSETGIVEPIISNDNSLYTDNEGTIFIL